MKSKLAIAGLAIFTSFNFAEAQILYTPNGQMGNSLNNNIGINTANPESPLQILGTLKIGNTTSPIERQNSILKFGDGSYVKIGEFETDDRLSFFANQFNFTQGNVGIGLSGTATFGAKLNIQSAWGDYIRFSRSPAIGHWGINPIGPSSLQFYNQPEDGTSPLFGILTLTTSGNVGIGTATPGAKLDVLGNIKMAGPDFVLGYNDGRFQGIKSGQRALVHAASTTQDILVINYAGDFEDGTQVHGDLSVLGKLNVGNITINNADKEQLDIKANLKVSGKIATQEVCVNPTSTWCDYVFEDNYKLMPLKELRQYIALNKHLPEVPTTTEVEKSGVNLGEINVTYLKKIEELTLYILQQQQQLETLQVQVASLKSNK